MGHEGHHHHEERKPLSFFASPLHEPSLSTKTPVSNNEKQPSVSDTDVEQQYDGGALRSDSEEPNFENMDCSLHDNPAFHHHAEATTAELFYDLFFVANLTSFTSTEEINDRNSLTAYIGFFSILWLTWYQVSLYDVRFSTDSVFERIAKALHFGVMVGFAVIGAQWKPGQEISDYRMYRAFGFILLASRLTLFMQYGVTLWYTKKYSKTILPLAFIMSMTLLAGILYAATTAAFPKTKFDETGTAIDQESNVYIAWYIIGVLETILTVAVSSIWRIVSFKGTHMVQRMSLLTLIILGEGIIVVCEAISKIVENEYNWTGAVAGQIIAAILIIYFLYMLYFDRMQEEHFGTIKQQIWSFLHFPLHVALVLVLQGVSLLIIWRQAVVSLDGLVDSWEPALQWADPQDEGAFDNSTAWAQYFLTDYINNETYPTKGAAFASYFNYSAYAAVYNYIPESVDASKQVEIVHNGWFDIQEGLDNWLADKTNNTAFSQLDTGVNAVTAATYKTLFDTFSVRTPEKGNSDGEKEAASLSTTSDAYFEVFDLILTYTFVAGGLALILATVLGFVSLPPYERRASTYARLAVNVAMGLGLSLLATIRYNDNSLDNYLGSSWIVPTICIVLFICVVINHVSLPKRKMH